MVTILGFPFKTLLKNRHTHGKLECQRIHLHANLATMIINMMACMFVPETDICTAIYFWKNIKQFTVHEFTNSGCVYSQLE